MLILGIETSCDETAAAVVSDKKEILSNVIYSQIDEHRIYNGVVPEVAARAHLEKIEVIVDNALSDAGVGLNDIDAIAGTCGPGLIGGLIVGATFAKSMAMALQLPFIAVNHIAAHALSIRLVEDIEFPYLLLLVSGGHCIFCCVRSFSEYEILGQTVDDSAGEAFDKVSKLLGFGYPGGPQIEKFARLGDPKRFLLPRPLCHGNSYDFSFSGLKTAVLLASKDCVDEQDKFDLCASFQQAVTDVFVYKARKYLQHCDVSTYSALVMAGGVAANRHIRSALESVCCDYRLKFCAPPLSLCTDNGAMIAWLGVEKLKTSQADSLYFRPNPRWGLV